jgi:hypothetical protein
LINGTAVTTWRKKSFLNIDELEEPNNNNVNFDGIGDVHTTANNIDNDNNDNENNDNDTNLNKKIQNFEQNEIDHDQDNDKVRGTNLFQNAEIFLPHDDRYEIAKEIGRKEITMATMLAVHIKTRYSTHADL